MLDGLDSRQPSGSCIVSIKALSANVQKVAAVRFALSKDTLTLVSQDVTLEPRISRYSVNQTFEFPLIGRRSTQSGLFLEEKVTFCLA